MANSAAALQEESRGRRAFTTERDPRSQRIEHIVVILMIAVPTIGTVLGVAMLASGVLTLYDHLLFVGMYLLSGFGITIGYHRHFTHRSFQTSAPMQAALAIAGAMAVQGPVLRWVGDHRRHHVFSDLPGDPHSPSRTDKSRLGGLWYAHIGWLFDTEKTAVRHYAADLVQNPQLAWIDRHYPLWVALSLLVPAGIGYAVSGTVTGALAGFLWAGLTRIFVVQHLTWSINSIGHTFGSARHSTGDLSRNHRLLGLLSLGEGWHNNHHSQPSSAIHGFHRGEIDMSAIVIRMLERVGAVWDVRTPRI